MNCFSFILQEGKSIKSSSGFSGKGFKFDETEHALANERKKLQKAALGLQDSDDEDGALDVSYIITLSVLKTTLELVRLFVLTNTESCYIFVNILVSCILVTVVLLKHF